MMKIMCKIFGHKWKNITKEMKGRTVIEADYVCKRCKWNKVKKQYIGTVLVTTYDHEWQRKEEYTKGRW